MNALLSISSIIFPIITFPYISRILTNVGTGKIATATSVIAYFNIFAQLGIPTYGVRACAKVRDDKEKLTRTAHELLMINLIMSAFMYVLLFFALLFVPILRDDKMLYIITSATILLTSIGMEWLYKALEQYTYITIRSVIFKIIAIGLMFLLVHEQKDYVIYGGIAIFASSASYILNFINLRKYIDLKPVGGYDLRRHLKPVGIFLAMSCATTIYTNLDTVMLRVMTDEGEVGLYNAAVKIKTVLLSVVTSLGAVLLPRVSYYIENNMFDEFKKVSAKAINFVLVFAGGAMIYFIFMANQCIMLISGEGFAGAVKPMQIIVPTILIIGLSNIFGIQMLVPLGKEKALLGAEIGGAIIDMALNAILIPRFRSSGASIGTLVAEIFVTTYLFIYLRNELKGVLKRIKLFKILFSLALASGIMIGSMYSVRQFVLPGIYDSIFNILPITGHITEIKSLVELFISFVVFSISYLTILIITKESFINDILANIKSKLSVK